ncbi:MAG: hypothetical protein EON59_14185 [Alphaproteobacteria bacterium]|nr:MAG: hypothetical protein EON59_14185 [Alphaproteobacteria bacterium]
MLGYATGYGAAALEPFIKSLRAWFDGEVILAIDDRSDVRDLLTAFGVTAAFAHSRDAWTPHPVMERFAAYDSWLNARPWLKQVLLTDVRDVVFQGDPFARPAERLEVYVEREGEPLAAHAFNLKHLKALVGEDFSERLRDRPCLCVGTVFGPTEDVTRLCRTMLMLAAIPRSGAGGAFGADQAACNLAVHLGLIDADIRPNYERVATIGDEGGLLVWRDDGVILNPDGGASPIVHQYDRHPHLADGVRARWGRPDHCVVKARRKTLGDRGKRLMASVNRRLPELR